MTIAKQFKKLWVRGLQRGIVFANRNSRFNQLYQVNDPWEMASDREQLRFRETCRIIEKEFGRIGALLEIGCGEGHQSQHLEQVCELLYGIDVSKTALARAQRRCPTARLSVADLSTYRPELPKFDLVVACEVLYYVKDVPAALRRMSELGQRCLVTYVQSGPCVLDAFFTGIPVLGTRVIQGTGSSWKVVWWENAGADRERGS